MAQASNIDTLDRANVISATHRPDGSVAAVITKDESGHSSQLIQYAPDGSVLFVQELTPGLLEQKDVTYRKDGTVSSITKHDEHHRTVTLYDANGGVSTSIHLNEDDQVNFKDGMLSSVIKYTGERFGEYHDMDETQYGPDGKIISSVHKVRYIKDFRSSLFDGGKWLTTSETTYYPNGHKASTITYKQKTGMKRTGQDYADNCEQNDEADSYRSSIIQYDEKGKIVISVKLNEQDEVSYNGDKIATITRRDKDNNLLSTANYDENGKIASLQNYDKTGKIISSVSYENGRPVTGRQSKSPEGYEDIFVTPKQNAKTGKKSLSKEKLNGASKDKKTPRHLQQQSMEK